MLVTIQSGAAGKCNVGRRNVEAVRRGVPPATSHGQEHRTLQAGDQRRRHQLEALCQLPVFRGSGNSRVQCQLPAEVIVGSQRPSQLAGKGGTELLALQPAPHRARPRKSWCRLPPKSGSRWQHHNHPATRLESLRERSECGAELEPKWLWRCWLKDSSDGPTGSAMAVLAPCRLHAWVADVGLQ